MRYAIISDIHANLPALELVLNSIRGEHIQEIVCLGDLVGLHTSPGECIDALRSASVRCIAGNHDDGVTGRLDRRHFPLESWDAIRWTRSKLNQSQMSFLKELPHMIAIENLGLAMHGMFRNNRRYLVGSLKLAVAAVRTKRAGFDIAMNGHTHRATCYRIHTGLLPVEITALETFHPQHVSDGACYIINPGSVGEPRDGVSRATYAIIDKDARSVEWRRLNYDYGAVVAETVRVFPDHTRLRSALPFMWLASSQHDADAEVTENEVESR
jgi:predicted phosphodiesterase